MHILQSHVFCVCLFLSEPLIVPHQFFKGHRYILVDHTPRIQCSGFLSHHLKSPVSGIVDMSENMVMSPEISVPFHNGKMTHTNLSLPVRDVYHLIYRLKITAGTFVFENGLIMISDYQIFDPAQLLQVPFCRFSLL